MTLNRKAIRTAHVLFWILILYLVYLQLMVVSFLIYDYQDLYSWFTSQFPDAYLISEYGTRYFTIAHFRFIQKSGGVFVLLLFLMMLFLFFKRAYIITISERLFKDLGHLAGIVAGSFSNLSTAQKWILWFCFFFLALLKVNFFITLPFYVDEVFNFVYFVDKGFLHTTLYTNNHALYNLVSALWWKTGMSPEVSSRLTSIFSGLFVNILLFAVTRYYFNFKTAVLVLILTGISFWTNVYSVQGSAYILMSLCCLVSIISLFRFAEDQEHGYYLFTLSCILGFYCSRLFIIPFLTFILVWIGIGFAQGWQHRKIGVRIVKSTAAVFLFAGLLYLPMYLWSGGDALFMSNVPRHDLVTMSPMFFESLSMMTEVNNKSYLVISGLFILSTLFLTALDRKVRLLIALNAAAIISILLFTAAVHIYPPSRSVIYINIFFFGTIGVVIGTIIPKFVTRLNQLVVIWLVVILFKAWGSLYLLNYGWQKSPGSLQDFAFYNRLNRLTNCIVKNKPTLIFSDKQDTFLNFYLAFAAIRKKTPLHFTYDPNKMNQAGIIILNQDSIPATLDKYNRLEQDEFGMIFYKTNLHNALLIECITEE